ncbi:host nuclease inhibitor protein [Comamonas fluminis]|uniref:host nuclease inhibitor protein n=1 Tax=Comamonas fluminis TaxID=2796366 RepID=UPI001FE26B86|nr:host nuclease inhibitor protein [Comamonas fluminis]
MTPQIAWCWASGLIEIGAELPSSNAIEIARGPHFAINGQVSVYARHGYGESKGKLLVPGVPEAADQAEGLEALSQWLKQINKRKPRDGVVFAKEVT